MNFNKQDYKHILKISSAIVIGILIGLATLHLINYLFGFAVIDQFLYIPAIMRGASMIPTFPSGCTFLFVDMHTDQNTIEKDDIITVKNRNFAHRIVYKTNSFDPDNGKYKIEKIDDKLHIIYNEHNELHIVETNYNKQQINKLEGKQIYITKGDNNEYIDPVLIKKQDVDSILIEDTSIK
jgi:signal peptidase I